MSELKNSIRSALLQPARVRTVTIEHAGVRFLVRQPNTRISKAVDAKDSIFDKMLTSVIECTFTEDLEGGLGERVFAPSDYEALLDQPGDKDSLLGKISAALLELSNWKEAEQAAKKP